MIDHLDGCSHCTIVYKTKTEVASSRYEFRSSKEISVEETLTLINSEMLPNGWQVSVRTF